MLIFFSNFLQLFIFTLFFLLLSYPLYYVPSISVHSFYLFLLSFLFSLHSSSILPDNPIILKLFPFSQFSRLTLFLISLFSSPFLSKKRKFQYLHRYRYFQNCSLRYYMGTSSIIKGSLANSVVFEIYIHILYYNLQYQ